MEKRKPGRPKKYKTKKPSDETVLRAIKGCGGIIKTVATKLDCSWATCKKWIDSSPECSIALTEEREGMLDLAEHALLTNVKNQDQRAIEFFLQTQGKARGFTPRQEITGANGKDLKINIVIKE